MCLIGCAWKQHPDWPLILWANRDEFRARPAAALARWDDDEDLIGGRDLQEGGSWLLLSRRRRMAAVTNVRRVPFVRGARSRGHLVREFVDAPEAAPAWLLAKARDATDYAPFNLLAWDGDRLMLAGHDRGLDSEHLEPGVHGISNGLMRAPWAKSRRIVEQMQRWTGQLRVGAAPPDLAPAWDALGDAATQADDALPDTGIGLDRERWLSSSFIDGEDYGTRASTVVLAGEHGWCMVERRFEPGRRMIGETRLEGDWR